MNIEILDALWNRPHLKGYAPFVAYIDRNQGNRYQEHRLAPGIRYFAFMEGVTPGQDRFFTPLLFSGERKNENASPPSILYADLDNVRDSKPQLDVYWPHILWMTSHDNAQAVWFLDAPEDDLDAWHDLNQRMTYFMGADKGGWHASKLLRVPGTHNYKYEPAQMGTVISFTPDARPYEAEALREHLPLVRGGGRVSDTHPELQTHDEWRSMVAREWNRIPLLTRADILRTGMPDRSEALVRASNKLRFAGFDATARFHLLWWVTWNKFRTDKFRPDEFWRITSYEG